MKSIWKGPCHGTEKQFSVSWEEVAFSVDHRTTYWPLSVRVNELKAIGMKCHAVLERQTLESNGVVQWHSQWTAIKVLWLIRKMFHK